MNESVESKKRQEASERYKQQSKSESDVREDKDADETRADVRGQMNENDAADIALAAVDELADQASDLEALQTELDETKDQLLRKVAEFQNYRRRTEDEKSKLVQLGKSIVIQQFLDVLDDLRRSLEAAEKVEADEAESPGPAYDALRGGVELVFKKFTDELAKHGVEPIEAVGKPFNENEHEAMMQREEEDVAPNTVVDELQKGYRMGDRILRHSKVIVSS